MLEDVVFVIEQIVQNRIYHGEVDLPPLPQIARETSFFPMNFEITRLVLLQRSFSGEKQKGEIDFQVGPFDVHLQRKDKKKAPLIRSLLSAVVWAFQKADVPLPALIKMEHKKTTNSFYYAIRRKHLDRFLVDGFLPLTMDSKSKNFPRIVLSKRAIPAALSVMIHELTHAINFLLLRQQDENPRICYKYELERRKFSFSSSRRMKEKNFEELNEIIDKAVEDIDREIDYYEDKKRSGLDKYRNYLEQCYILSYDGIVPPIQEARIIESGLNRFYVTSCQENTTVISKNFTIDELEMLFEESFEDYPSSRKLLEFINAYKDWLKEKDKIENKIEDLLIEKEGIRISLIHRFAAKSSKWFPSTYSLKNPVEWFAELLKFHLINPLQTDPEVKDFIEEVFREELDPIVSLYEG